MQIKHGWEYVSVNESISVSCDRGFQLPSGGTVQDVNCTMDAQFNNIIQCTGK